jgi:hypothetical protein
MPATFATAKSPSTTATSSLPANAAQAQSIAYETAGSFASS